MTSILDGVKSSGSSSHSSLSFCDDAKEADASPLSLVLFCCEGMEIDAAMMSSEDVSFAADALIIVSQKQSSLCIICLNGSAPSSIPVLLCTSMRCECEYKCECEFQWIDSDTVLVLMLERDCN